VKPQNDVCVLSVQGQALREIACGSRELPSVEIGEAAAIKGHGLFRIEADRLVEIRNRAGVLSLEYKDAAAADETEGIVRIETDRLVEIGDGEVVLRLVRIGGAAADEGEGIFRVESDRLVEIRNRAIVLSPEYKDAAAAIERESKFRVEAAGSCYLCLREAPFPVFDVELAAAQHHPPV
jgi:hypothetical protein